MSPAFADLRYPIQHPKPKKDSVSSPLTFDFSRYSVPSKQTLNPVMDSRGGKTRNFDENSQQTVPEVVFASSSSVSSAPGSLKPRMVKFRRNFGTLRRNAPATSLANKDSVVDTGVDQFLSGVSHGTDDGIMRNRGNGANASFDQFKASASVLEDLRSGKGSRMPLNDNSFASEFNPLQAGQNHQDKRPDKLNASDSEFSPFLSGTTLNRANRKDSGEMQKLRDQLYSCNPLRRPENIKSSRSTDSTSVKDEFGKFVFGGNKSVAGDNLGSYLNPESKISLPDEMRKLNIGSTVEPEIINGGIGFTADGNASTDGVFIFGRSVDKSSTSIHRSSGDSFVGLAHDMRKLNINVSSGDSFVGLPHEMSKLKINGEMASQSKKDGGINFTFTAGTGPATRLQSDPGGAPRAGAFIFGSAGDKISCVDSNLADKSSLPSLSGEMKKLNLAVSTSEDVDEKANESDFRRNGEVIFDFVFGLGNKNETTSINKNVETELPSQMKKLNIQSQGVDEDGTDNRLGNENVTSYITEEVETELPSQMKKLNIKSKAGGKDGTDNSSCKAHPNGAKFQIPANRIFTDAIANTSFATPFTFQAGMGRNGSLVHPVQPTHPNDDCNFEAGIRSAVSSSTDHGFQSSCNSFEQPCADQGENKAPFSFTTMHEVFVTPNLDSSSPKYNPSSWSHGEGLFGGSYQNVEFSAKQSLKDIKSKKRRGKSGWKKLISAEKKSQETLDSGSPGYSPMDFSPYAETLTTDQCSRETSVASGESLPLGATDAQGEVRMEARDDLLSAQNPLNTSEVSLKHGVPSQQGSNHQMNHIFCPEGSARETEYQNDGHFVSTNIEDGRFCSNGEFQESSNGMFSFHSSAENSVETNFTFAATTQKPLSTAKRHYRKKNLSKVSYDSHASLSNVKYQTSTSMQFASTTTGSLQQDSGQVQQFSSSSQLEPGQSIFSSQNETNKEPGVGKNPMTTATATDATQEACEKWRQRGNQAYASGNLSKAEDYYTRGVNCVSPKHASRSCAKARMLCYSNRAATRMSLGRMRDALGDCLMATAIEPKFLRAQVRAANCYLALGEIEDALKHFKKCLQIGCEESLDKKLNTEAADGLRKAQQLAGYMDRTVEFLQRRTYSDAANALDIIDDALLISPYSENLIEMKAEALLVLRKYEEAVKLCEQTLESSERNFLSYNAEGKSKDASISESRTSCSVNLWRWCLISRSYFYLGRLEEALDLCQKYEQLSPIKEKYGITYSESPKEFAAVVRDLLHHKAQGNEAFQAGRHAEAVECYTGALQCSVESRPYAAVCFANRAAAYQALGQITEAIADCSLAMALDSSYPKAISRRATLHEMIRDYGQAVNDLQRLISLLEKLAGDKTGQFNTSGRSTSSAHDIRQARMRLASVEEEAKKDIPLDMYLILGIEPTSTAVDVKKAYRKAALRHHPDKAVQFLPRSENGVDGLWKEVADEVHKDADRLFKMIAEAYAVISDSTKRLRYDAEEEIRNARKTGSGCSTPVSHDPHVSYEKTSSRYWKESWKSNGCSRHQWSESNHSSRYY